MGNDAFNAKILKEQEWEDGSKRDAGKGGNLGNVSKERGGKKEKKGRERDRGETILLNSNS